MPKQQVLVWFEVEARDFDSAAQQVYDLMPNIRDNPLPGLDEWVVLDMSQMKSGCLAPRSSQHDPVWEGWIGRTRNA